MKNLIYIILVAGCLGLIAYGLAQKNQPQTEVPAAENQAAVETPTAVVQNNNTGASAVAPAASSAGVISSTPLSVATKHYRPDQAVVSATAETATVDAERNFIITPEIIAKKHLVDKYKIGICFGQAITVPDSAIKSLVSANPSFSNYLRQAYGLTTDLEVYNKIKQFQTITLKEQASSVYAFNFSDGQCQTVIYYAGTVTVSGSAATDIVTTQQSHTY